MKIKLHDASRPPSETEIAAFEIATDCTVGDAYRRFLKQWNGAKPENNWFKVGERNHSSVTRFIPLAEIPKELSLLKSELPRGSFPIAWDESGNYVCLNSRRNGEVFFWDHELPERTVTLSQGLDGFVDHVMEPFEPTKLKFEPHQVKSAWVDPEFLKQLKKKS